MQPKTGLTNHDIDLAIKYLASLDVIELGKLFGFDESAKALDNSYHFVEKITPANPRKAIEQNTAFSFLLEGTYSHQKSYTLYVSKDQLLEFSSKQKEIDLEIARQKHSS